MILHIDTKDQKRVTVKIKDNGRVVKSLGGENVHGSEILLPLIEKLLKQTKLDFKDLSGMKVEVGPGSFTGLRVGVAVANALGFALGIPINGKKIETELKY